MVGARARRVGALLLGGHAGEGALHRDERVGRRGVNAAAAAAAEAANSAVGEPPLRVVRPVVFSLLLRLQAPRAAATASTAAHAASHASHAAHAAHVKVHLGPDKAA
jgi:hypothetical protein